jgi:hypothetical protein
MWPDLPPGLATFIPRTRREFFALKRATGDTT